ncbi:hypothetical protein HYU92_01135 [Candidatus Curtissbacteria bacterium]|nr:hypothetical protein [Candidatus Curtissbacteria bacterium]
MIVKSLLKLIDEAIMPAAALIIGKMLGLLLASLYFQLPFTVQAGHFLKILPAVEFANLKDYILAESYSNMGMFIAASLGTLLVIIQAHYFHESHIHPTLHAKLVALNLENLVAPSYHLYHQAAIWLIFLWLTVGFLIISTVLGITYPYLAFIAFIVAANFSWVFAIDIEREIELSRN